MLLLKNLSNFKLCHDTMLVALHYSMNYLVIFSLYVRASYVHMNYLVIFSLYVRVSYVYMYLVIFCICIYFECCCVLTITDGIARRIVGGGICGRHGEALSMDAGQASGRAAQGGDVSLGQKCSSGPV